jgi:hypothetical protein
MLALMHHSHIFVNLKTLFMKTQLSFITVSVIALSLISCGSNDLQKREEALQEKELELRRKETELENKQSEIPASDMNTMYQEPISTKKFLYVVIRTLEPKIISEFVQDEQPPKRQSNPNPYTDGILPREIEPEFIQTPRYVVRSKPEYFTYTSDIIEVENFTEDSKYIEQDRFEKKVQKAVNDANRRIQFEQQSSGKQVDAEAKIISRKSFVFDTYSEASSNRAAERNVDQ